jgi:uncharacterized protein (DUF58 family)
MRRVRLKWEREWTVAAAGVALALAGWLARSSLLAIGGLLVAATVIGLWIWQQQSLASVTYDRRLGRNRALFGEEIPLEIEVVNDKLLPLTWLHVEDQVPGGLQVKGATLRLAANGRRHEMHHLLPMLPYQRVRRTMTVVCTNRGEHTFGPGHIESGDPFCLRRRDRRIPRVDRILVYPKIFRVDALEVIGRLSLGDRRGDPRLAGDPSRVAGVREYRPGDPLRHVDWRATARGGSLLVREYEPTAALQLALFSDIRIVGDTGALSARDAVEFTLAVTASLVADLVERKVPTGLYSSATVAGRPVVHHAGRGAESLPAMLESLAVASPYGRVALADLLAGETTRLRTGTSLVVVALDFTPPLNVALAQARRRMPVAAVWVDAGQGSPPHADVTDSLKEVRYHDEWRTADILELAS